MRDREQWERDNANRLSHYRDDIIEECARLIEQCRTDMIYKLDAAAAILALKDER